MRQAPNAKLRLYIVAALHTGGRRAELLRLTWNDVDVRQRTITFRDTKNGDSRTVPMTETIRTILAGLPRPLNAASSALPRLAPAVLTPSFASWAGCGWGWIKNTTRNPSRGRRGSTADALGEI